MITGRTLHRMEWRLRKLIRRSDRYWWHGDEYESCIYAGKSGLRQTLPGAGRCGSRAGKTPASQFRRC